MVVVKKFIDFSLKGVNKDFNVSFIKAICDKFVIN